MHFFTAFYNAISHLWTSLSYALEACDYLSGLRNLALKRGLDKTSQYGWLCDQPGRFTRVGGDFKQAQIIQQETLNLFIALDDKGGIMLSSVDFKAV